MRNLSPATATRILSVSAKLFAENHFDEIRMDQVATEAGVSKMTLYRYFSTKDELYQSLLEIEGKDYLNRLRTAAESAIGCRERLVAVAREAMGYFAARRHLVQLLDRAAIDRGRGEGFPWLEVQRELFRMAKGLFAEGVATGEFMVEDLDMAVRGLLGTMRFQHLYPCPLIETDRIPDRIIQMLTRETAVLRQAG